MIQIVYKNETTYETIKKAEELEWTRNKIRDSGTLVTHLESVKERFENTKRRYGYFQKNSCFENGRCFYWSYFFQKRSLTDSK